MATAATSLLGLALPVTGELSGTWGDTVNVSITALLDTAVAGTTTLSSDADVTLTTTTLAANQARQAIILWTAGGTVTRTITVPAQSKSYIVINKTSSSQSIKIVGVGPTTGVTIVAGTAAFVVWNGVDFVTASVTSTTGILPVANGGTGLSSGTSGGVLAYTATGTLASSAALAASALVIGGGAGAAPSTTTTGTGVVTALGVNTGTAGAFVVNGGALGSPSSVGTMPAFTLGGTVSGGGNQINNVVIGTTTPLAGNFTTLTTSSTVTHNGGTANGVAYLDGSKVLTTGTALTFDGTYFTVGASSTTGDYKAFIQKAGGELLGLNASSGTLARIAFGNATASFGSTQIIANAADLAFITNSAEQMRLTSTGLGIGTNLPDAKLTVYGNAPAFTMQTSRSFTVNRNWQIGVDQITEGNWTLTPSTTLGGTTYTTPAITVSPSGNLGLGVAPSAWNSVYRSIQLGIGASISGRSDTNTWNELLSNAYRNTSGDWTYLNTDYAASYRMAVGAHSWYNAPSGTAGNPISFTQAMTLDASGNLGIVTTSPASFFSDADNLVVGTTSGNNGITILSGSTGTSVLAFGYTTGTSAGNASNRAKIYYDGTSDTLRMSNGGALMNTTQFVLDASGNLGLGVTPSAWANSKAFDIGGFGALSTDTLNDANTSLSWNAYATAYNAWKYKNTGSAASKYTQEAGAHAWFNAASGTAGNAITFTQAMTLDASGNLGVGTTSPSGRLTVLRSLTGATDYTTEQVSVFNSATGATGNQATIGFHLGNSNWGPTATTARISAVL